MKSFFSNSDNSLGTAFRNNLLDLVLQLGAFKADINLYDNRKCFNV